MMSSSEVNSRETYLRFRKEWKNAYKALSSEIRETRKITRQPEDSAGTQARAQSRRHYLRLRARKMMEELEAVKQLRPIRMRPEKAAA
jgi:hypothetical protein